MTIRVVLADDHVLVRQSLKSLLEREGFHVVGEASDGQEAIRRVESLHPNIAVMDISMPTLNGVDAARELSRSSPKTNSILLTQHNEDQYVSEALEAGVKGYVLKSQAACDLVQAINQISRGEAKGSANRSGAASTPVDCRGEIDERNRIVARYKYENSGISPHETHAEAGYPRDRQPCAVRGAPWNCAALIPLRPSRRTYRSADRL
jgi:DNA-binding NarL/FixJ family response regulator